jgi:large subunit ribosomal protein L17
MRHRVHSSKLGRKGQHRNAMLANMVCSLIKHKRITTTLAKAKVVRPVAEKMVTLGKRGSMHHRRIAAARLRNQARTLHKSSADRIAWRENEDVVRILFDEIAPSFAGRNGGYTRIIKLGARKGDAGQKAIIEWIGSEDTDSTAVDASSGESVKQSDASSNPVVEAESEVISNEETVAPKGEGK